MCVCEYVSLSLCESVGSVESVALFTETDTDSQRDRLTKRQTHRPPPARLLPDPTGLSGVCESVSV